MDVFAGVETRIAFIILAFRYSVAASISSLVFSEVEAEVVCVKTSLKSCQLVLVINVAIRCILDDS